MEVDRLNGEIRTITEEVAGSDSRIAVLHNDIRHNTENDGRSFPPAGRERGRARELCRPDAGASGGH